MHLNSQKRIYLENAVYFVTTKTKENYPYFRDIMLARLCMSKIILAQEWMGFIIYGFVIMPNHIHMMIMPMGKHNVSQIMHNIKRNTSRSANIWLAHRHHMGEDDHPHTKKSHNYVGEDDHPRLRKNVDIINMVKTKFAWQSSFHDHIIRDERDLFHHLEYIKINPVKHGVVKVGEEYPFMHTDVSYER